MPYFLKHHFDPDFDHLNIKNQARDDGRVDHRQRDYVHNVIVGQVLAELLEIEEHDEGRYDSRFVLDTPVFPMGANTEVDPEHPNRLLATINGYVYLDPEGLITVKSLLNVRRDVDFATGNISFVGDIVVHGAVRSGFSIKARNILVKGTVEAATLEATQSIHVQAGVKGDKRADLRAKGSIKVKFCENATISAGKNLLVEGACMHCRLFIGNALAVRDRLVGGETNCRHLVHVGRQLGGGLNTTTTLTMGYDPFLMHRISEVENAIKTLQWRGQDSATKGTARNGATRPVEVDRKIMLLEKQRQLLTEKLATEDLQACSVIVPGEVRPGVEVSIGQAYHMNSDFLQDMRFFWENEKIVLASPAEPRK